MLRKIALGFALTIAIIVSVCIFRVEKTDAATNYCTTQFDINQCLSQLFSQQAHAAPNYCTTSYTTNQCLNQIFPSQLFALISGTTPVQNAANGNCLYNNNGILGNQACGGSYLPLAGGTMTGPINALTVTMPNDGTASENFTLSGRSGVTIPVPNVTASGASSPIAFDIAPTNGASDFSSIGVAWIDICDAVSVVSCTAAGNANYESLRLGIHAGGQSFIGNAAGGSGSIHSLVLQPNGGAVLINTTAPTNATDQFSDTLSQNSITSETIGNGSTGGSAGTGLYFANHNSTTEVSLILNGSSNSGGNGANSFTINSAAGLWFQTAGVNAISINTSQLVSFAAQISVPNMTQSAAAQTGTVCWASGGLTYDATLGCLTSLEEFKDIHGPITNALAETVALKPFWFTPIHRAAGSDIAEQPGLGAHQVEAVDKRLVGYGADGKLRGVRYMEMTALLVAAVKELKTANDNQAAEIEELKARLH